MIKALSSVRPTTLRVNTLKSSPSHLEKILQLHRVQFDRVSWIKDAYIIRNAGIRELMTLAEYNSGGFYIQSLASMLPVLILNPEKQERILDIAAAPGSKTTQMAALMENTGQIMANDTSRIRRYKLEANLRIQGVTNTKISGYAGQVIWKKYPEYFDRILADVPCSLEGRISVGDPKSFADWSLKRIRSLSEIQKWILRSAVSAVKPGGTIVYSTCTLAPEENENVIDWILKKEQGAVITEIINVDIPGKLPGLSEWGMKKYHPSVKRCLRIMPNNLMEGFFIAKLRKIGHTVPENYVIS